MYRSLFATVALLLPLQAQTPTSNWAQINPVTKLSAATFATPPATDRPWVRMNIPPTAEPSEIAREVREIHEAGIAGIEVGQGGFPNNAQLIALYSAANGLGVKISLSRGPTQLPAGYSMDSEHARKTLFVGKAVVASGAVFEGQVPRGTVTQGSRSGFGPARGGGAPGGPRGPGGGGGGNAAQAARDKLVAVLAYRCIRCAGQGPAELDRSSAIDLTRSVVAGNLKWQAPSGGQWMIASFWARGVFAQPDPFSEEGYAEIIQSMESALSPEVKALLKANGGDLFYDSHSVDRGSPDELWTNRMAEEFRARRGYVLIPNLPALFREVFDFGDGSAARVRNDFYAVRGDLWLEKQIAPMRQWIRKYNNLLRVQVEGEANLTIPITDMIQATAAVDRPEHENLFVGDEVDNYLPMASANHMTGNSWYSTECCAALNRNYAQTFQDTVIRMHKSFAGGITKLVYHVYPYRDTPQSKWPGHHNFGQAGFSNAWGPRNPFWMDSKLYNDYFARNQQVLTQGWAKTDVAVYMHNYLYPPSQQIKTRHWRDLGLQEAGYTRDYLNPTMLDLPIATVKDGRLAADGPSYKALILDSQQEPPTDPVKTSMPVETARKILGFAKAGLPVIVVGAAPDRVPGNTPQEDAVLQAVIAQLLLEKTVARVASQAEVPAKLRSMGIRPAAEPALPSAMLSIRRRDVATRTDYYFLYNQGMVSPKDEPETLFEPASGEPLDREVSLEGSGRPYVMDAWSGKIIPIAQYRLEAGRVIVRIRLAADDGMVVAIAEDPKRFGVNSPAVYVTKTDADAVVAVANGVELHAAKTGTVSAALSNGRTLQQEIRNVPAALDLTKVKWHVVVEDWQPAKPYNDTVGPAAVETTRTKMEADLGELKAWPEIPAFRDVSGVGVYTTVFDLPSGWNAARHGAVLELGQVFDSFGLTVNGQAVSVDQISAAVDLGARLKAGRNTIQVRVATTLNNRLAKLDDAVGRRGIVQPYGLVGPVVLKPYAKVVVPQGR